MKKNLIFFLLLGWMCCLNNALAQAPVISSFFPSEGAVGSLVTINGSNLSSPTSVKVGAVNCIVISATATRVVGMVMPGSTTGLVSVTTGAGTANASTSFTVIPSKAPVSQEGLKISGTGGVGSTSYQGWSTALSADGNTAIMGGPFDKNGGGASWVFTRSAGVWSQQGPKLVATDTIGDPYQGWSVALSADGNTALVGAPFDSGGIGATWVFVRSGSSWTRQGSKLVGSGSVGTSVYQGFSVSLSADGNTALIGGPYDNGFTGAMWVFRRTGTNWSQVGSKLTCTGATGIAAFGWSVAISADGKTAIGGGYYDNTNIGASWIFTTTNGTSWSQQGAKLVGTGVAGSTVFQGYSVALSADGNTAVVGGSNDNGGIGATWVFTRSGTSWSQQGSKLVGSGSVGSAAQGTAVAISADGNRVLTGGNNDNSSKGAVWIFERSGTSWTQYKNKVAGTGSSGFPQQGTSLAVSADGNNAIIGGYGDNSLKGAAWIFIPASDNADLASLTISSGTLSPAFSKATTAYSVSVANAATTVTVTPTVDEFHATIQVRVNNGAFSPVVSGAASTPLALNIGANTIDILVTAEDSTQKTYTITVSRSCPVITASLSGSASVCSGASTNLTVSIAGGVAPYTVVYSGGTITNYQSADNIPVSPTGNTVYALTSVQDANNCPATTSGYATVTIKAVAGITSITATANPICASGTTGLTANGVAGANAVVTWYTGPGATGTNLGTGTSLTNRSTGTYYARVTADCGVPDEASIIITAKTNVSVGSVTASTTALCSGATTTLTANGVTGTNAIVTWYSGANGTGTNYGTGTSLPNRGPGTYYARVTGDCGTPAEASATVALKADAGITAVSAATNPICVSATTSLTAVGVTGANAVVTWYTGSNGTGTNLGTGTSLSNRSAGTYYARVTADCGVPAEASITISSISGPIITSVTAATNPVCPSGVTNLAANGVTGANPIVTWWTGPGGTGSNLGTGSSLNNKGAGTYYARVTADCGSPVEASTVITTATVPSIANQSTSTCSGIAFTVNPAGAPGGTTYSWTAPSYTGTVTGGSAQSLQSSIGQTLTNAGPAQGTAVYTVTPYSGSCAGSNFTTTVTVNPLPTPTFITAPGGNTCASDNVTYTTQAGMSNYTWSLSGVVNTDYTVTGGSTSASSNSVTVRWLTTGSKTVTVNYRNSNNCLGNVAASSSTLVNTGLTPSVSITITAGNNPACSNSSITFTATPVNGGTSPSYQWFKNGSLDASVTGPVYTVSNISATNKPLVHAVMIPAAGTCVAVSSATSNSIQVLLVSNSWSGSFNSQWSDGRNWCSGTTPVDTSDVFIPVAANYPVISAASTIRNIQVQSGASVTINNATLTINGTISGGGQFVGASSATLKLNYAGSIGTLNLAPAGIGSLIISGSGASLTLGTSANIYRELNIGSATLISNSNLTLKSNINGTAWVAPVNGGSITGNVTVERYIPQNAFRAWRLLSVPVKGSQTFKQAWQENQPAMVDGLPGYGTLLTNSTGTNGYDTITQGNSLLQFTNGMPGSFSAISSTNNVMQTTGGYFVYIRGNRSTKTSGSVFYPSATTLRTNGELYIGTQPAVVLPAGQNVLIGNVYPSAIDFDLLTKSGISAFKVWDPKLPGSYNVGAYQSFSALNGYDPIPGGGSYASTPNSRIESGQAFMVTSTNGGSLQLKESAKVSFSRNFFKPAKPVAQFKTRLLVPNNAATDIADGHAVVFGSTFTNELDESDVIKVPNLSENLGIQKGHTVLAIEAHNEVVARDTIVFAMSKLKQREYLLEFEPQHMDQSLSAYVEDVFEHTVKPISLSTTSAIHFYVNSNPASNASDRFRVVFIRKTSGVKVSLTALQQRDNSVALQWDVDGNEASIAGYEIEYSTDGEKYNRLETKQVDNKVYSWIHDKPVAGKNHYRIKALARSGSFVYSNVVTIAQEQLNGNFVVYPNPIKGQSLKVNFLNQQAGKYRLVLTDKKGNVVFEKTVSHAGGTMLQVAQLPYRFPVGSYQLTISSERKVKTTISVLIAD